ncbi:MAG: hypothetical protein AUI36_32050 [Cyanobacteria bacterium 13_1_40CM_2_61_4]|nr:MAG: hypothetical protein AUI36_32050 [Cyanobacteria bacterium 13_1_40CM_2_61_4]
MISSQKLLNIATVILTVAAVIVVGVFLQREFSPGKKSLNAAHVRDWKSFAAGSTRIGSDSPKVVITVFSDILCPHCGAVWRPLTDITRKHPRDVAFVYRHSPLYARAPEAARAGICAYRERKFVEIYDAFLALRDSLGIQAVASKQDSVGVANHWAALAKGVGISDSIRFLSCMNDPSVANELQSDIAAGNRLKVGVVPTILINDLRVDGNPGPVVLDSLVRAALSRE